jgi:hypothetical protein
MLGTLGLKILLIDEAATARTLKLQEPADRANSVSEMSRGSAAHQPYGPRRIRVAPQVQANAA